MADERASMDIAQLVAEHHRAVYGYAYRLTGTVADAEDLTQQVFLTAQAKLGQVRKEESVRSWLFAILRHRFVKTIRQRRPIPAVSIELNVDNIPTRVPPAEDIDREAIQRALDELPPAFRTVVTMFYYEDRSYREIAEDLDVPMGTVMSRLARAKAHLRTALTQRDGAPDERPVPRKASTRG
jgi:RNA polymerase sigma-70 factor (ECF subfamily)